MNKKRTSGSIIALLLVLALLISAASSVGSFAAGNSFPSTKRDWSRYVSRYNYERMTGEEKAFYNRIEGVCKDYLENNKEFIYQDSHDIYTLEPVDCGNLDINRASELIKIFRIENPQYYFLTGGAYFVGKKFYAQVYRQMRLASWRADTTKLIFDTFDAWVKEMNLDGKSQVEKVKIIDNFLCEKLTVSGNQAVNGAENSNQTICTVFQYQAGLCIGYTLTAYMFYNYVGVPAISVLAQNHIWNKVLLDDCWYNIDTYWNDGLGDKEFLLKSDEDIRLRDENNEHVARPYFFNPPANKNYEEKFTWKCDGNGWWVESTSGWYPVNSWQQIDGIWYFFKPDGYMASNEYYSGYWFNADGSWDSRYKVMWLCNDTGWWVEDISGWWPQNCWLKIDGYWYYFDASGYMVTNRYIDGWWIGADGVCY